MTWLYDLIACVWILVVIYLVYSAGWEEDKRKR